MQLYRVVPKTKRELRPFGNYIHLIRANINVFTIHNQVCYLDELAIKTTYLLSNKAVFTIHNLALLVRSTRY